MKDQNQSNNRDRNNADQNNNQKNREINPKPNTPSKEDLKYKQDKDKGGKNY